MDFDLKTPRCIGAYLVHLAPGLLTVLVNAMSWSPFASARVDLGTAEAEREKTYRTLIINVLASTQRRSPLLNVRIIGGS